MGVLYVNNIQITYKTNERTVRIIRRKSSDENLFVVFNDYKGQNCITTLVFFDAFAKSQFILFARILLMVGSSLPNRPLKPRAVKKKMLMWKLCSELNINIDTKYTWIFDRLKMLYYTQNQCSICIRQFLKEKKKKITRWRPFDFITLRLTTINNYQILALILLDTKNM